MNIQIILASASPRRRELLKQVGLCPEIVPSQADETMGPAAPDEMVKKLSARKASEVAARLAFSPDGGERVIIGADTVVAVDGRILGKPGTAEEAAAMIDMLQGRIHHVYTGVTMIFVTSGERVTFAEETEVEVYPMTAAQVDRYVATGEPMDKAGAYGIQGYFAAYIKGIRGDYNNVVGLPLARVCQELARRNAF